MRGWHTIWIVLLLLLLAALSVGSCILYMYGLYFCLLFTVLAIVVIISYVVYSRQMLLGRMVRMVEAIRYEDFSLNFSATGKSKMEDRLIEDINVVMEKFRRHLTANEQQYQYYETLLDRADTCLLVADTEGNVLWMNRSAVQELCGHAIHQLEELKVLNQDFPNLLRTLQPGEVKVIRIYKEEVMQDMAVTMTQYTTKGTDLHLVNLKNIRSILEENEMEAWQKLVRVLTHEIMNSIAPIMSLSETLLERASLRGMNEKDYDIMLQGMETIHRRSKGLLGFVENYRKLSRLASPILAPVKVGDLLGDVRKLVTASGIRFVYRIEDENQILMIDRSQMEQVLINLLKNACEACIEQPEPEVVIETSYLSEKHIFQLSVIDNGCGILPNVVDKIFIPFFTTKPAGSGIGLSLCKQIMTLHGGTLSVKSEVGAGSTFIMKFLCR